MARAGAKWGAGDLPDQKGRVALVTGAGAGIGREAARILAARGARVVLAVRDPVRGRAVAESIRGEHPAADVSVGDLDLANLASVESFARSVERDLGRVDLLVNNAGVMMCPYAKTRDGFEMQMGTNHLGHFALTGHLLPLLQGTAGSRVVVLSSVGHRAGEIDFDDLNWETREYDPSQAYYDSKLANLYFAYELARRLEGKSGSPTVTAAHPGWTRTELQRHSRMLRVLNWFLSQRVEIGALPTLRAATDPAARSRDYFGPGGLGEMRGYPVKVASSEASHDASAASELWARSEAMTGVRY